MSLSELYPSKVLIEGNGQHNQETSCYLLVQGIDACLGQAIFQDDHNECS